MAENLRARDAREGIAAFLDKRQPVWSAGQPETRRDDNRPPANPGKGPNVET